MNNASQELELLVGIKKKRLNGDRINQTLCCFALMRDTALVATGKKGYPNQMAVLLEMLVKELAAVVPSDGSEKPKLTIINGWRFSHERSGRIQCDEMDQRDTARLLGKISGLPFEIIIQH
jgi:hypothetical protein